MVAAVLGAGIVLATALLVADARERTFIVLASLFAVLGRQIVAAGLQLWVSAAGLGTALFDDEHGYLDLADELARSWHGLTPLNSGLALYLDNPIVTNTYVHIGGALFWAVGPIDIVLKLFNSAAGVVAALLVYRTMLALALPGARWALLFLFVFPSLILWSAIALKDSFVLLLIAFAVWATTELVRSARLLPWFPLVVIALIWMEGLRRFLFFALDIGWPLALLVSLGGFRRIAAFVAAAAVALVLLSASPARNYVLDPNSLQGPESVRRSMAEGARSAFVDPRKSPTVIEATLAPVTPVGTEQRSTPTALAPVTPTGTDVGPTATALAPHAVPGSRPPTEEAFSLVGRSLAANLLHLPVGVAYLLLAPFPLLASRLAEVALIPEMLLWYAALVLAVYGFVSRPAAWRGYALGILLIGAIGLVLSLAEGNVGTLVRHRAMLVLLLSVPAAVGFERAHRGLAERLRLLVRSLPRA